MAQTGREAILFSLLLAGCLYLPRFSAPLMWDDRPFLINVPALDRPIPFSSYVSPSYFGMTGELTWRPLATLTYALGTRAFGRKPFPLRLMMFFLHVVNCVLLALLVATAGLGLGVALSAAALFLVHPAHSETLMCVTFNKEILATLGILAMTVAHQRRRRTLAAAGLGFAALSKETGMLGLVLVLLYDLAFEGPKEIIRRWKDHALYVAVAAAYVLIRFGPMKGPGAEANLSAVLPWAERLYYAARGFVSSIQTLFFPWRLRIDYFALPPSSRLDYAAWILAAAAMLALVFGLAARARHKVRALCFFLLWPLPVLFLTSNLLPTAVLSMRLMAERWLYVPAVGFSVVFAYALRNRPRTLGFVLIFWSLLGFLRLKDWSSEPRLWRSLVDVYPWSAKANEGLGEALFRQGQVAEAESWLRKGLELREKHADPVLAHYVPLAPPGTIIWESAPLDRELGLCRLHLGDEKTATAFMKEAARLQPQDIFSRRVLAYTFAKRGDFAQARTWLDEGFSIDANDDFLLRLKADVERKHLSFNARFF